MSEIANIKLTQLEKLVQKIKASYSPEDTEQIEVSFELLVGSLYPTLYQNVMESIKDAYTQGVIDGMKEREGNNDN